MLPLNDTIRQINLNKNHNISNISVLVTGGCGFIGSHIVDALASQGSAVVVFDNLIRGSVKNIEYSLRSENVTLICGDVRSFPELKRVIKHYEVDAIIHEAALTNVEESIDRPRLYYKVNVNGTINVLEAARIADIRKVVFASSSSVYADKSEPVSEDDRLAPLSPYALTKLLGEKICLQYNSQYGMDIVVLRYFNVYGPRQKADSVIPIFVHRALTGRPLIIFGDGLQTRDFVHVSDVTLATLLALSLDSRRSGYNVFNIGTGRAVSIIELAKKILRLVHLVSRRDVNERLSFRPPRKGDVRHNVADITLARKVLGYTPVVDIEQGLKSYIIDVLKKLNTL